MKQFSIFSIALLLIISFSSCGVNGAMVLNQNSNATQVHLTKKNYRVVEQVTGSADVNYVMLIGGMNRKQLYQNAYSDLVKKADLKGSKALVNMVTEEHLGGVPPFFFKRTITVSAHVVEFID